MINDDDYLKIEPINDSDELPTETIVSDAVSTNLNQPQENQKRPPVKEFIKYICSKCNYKFTRKASSSQALRCPYCSGSTIEEDTFDLSETIREV
jgi:DNA-directed RNA polymerase subunit RPC12/RpoP